MITNVKETNFTDIVNISDCLFIRNITLNGGAVVYAGRPDKTIHVINSELNNKLTGQDTNKYGNDIQFENNGTVNLIDCYFTIDNSYTSEDPYIRFGVLT